MIETGMPDAAYQIVRSYLAAPDTDEVREQLCEELHTKLSWQDVTINQVPVSEEDGPHCLGLLAVRGTDPTGLGHVVTLGMHLHD